MNSTALLGLLGLALVAMPALAEDNTVALSLDAHKFTPPEIRVKANVPTVITLTNNDTDREEFDSASLRMERVVAGHATITFRLRPLAPGRYPFVGEFHSATARGVVVAE